MSDTSDNHKILLEMIISRFKLVRCYNCNGSGKTVVVGWLFMWSPCPCCNGTGLVELPAGWELRPLHDGTAIAAPPLPKRLR